MASGTTRFSIWTDDSGRPGCYLGPKGLVAWRKDAASFATIEEANAEIARRGLTNSMSVVSGKVTAYVVEADPIWLEVRG